MNRYDIKRLALVVAVQAEIEGMKAENFIRQTEGNALAYDGDDFDTKANDLVNLAHANDEQL